MKTLNRLLILTMICASVLALSSCPDDPDDPELGQPGFTSIKLGITDTVSMTTGVLLDWNYTHRDTVEEPLSWFEIFYRHHTDTANTLIFEKVDPKKRALSWPLDDSLTGKVEFGIRAVYEEQTGQQWKNDSIAWDSLLLTSKILLQKPVRGSIDSGRDTPFEVQTVGDYGVQLRFMLYVNKPPQHFSMPDTTFPFENPGYYFRQERPGDTLHIGIDDSATVNWCVLATRETDPDLKTGLSQSITCSSFIRDRR